MSKSNRISEKTNEQNVSWQEDFQFAEYWLDQRNLAGMNVYFFIDNTLWFGTGG